MLYEGFNVIIKHDLAELKSTRVDEYNRTMKTNNTSFKK